MNQALTHRPIITAGLLIGAGMGGFVDGIVLHQILQWHNLLSARLPPDTLVNSKINMFWDGVFHAGVWSLTAVGVVNLFRAGNRREVAWSGRTFGGALLAGWGTFNLVEGLIDHQILGLHHVHEYTTQKGLFDGAFLALGAFLVFVGWMLIRSGASDTTPNSA